MTEPTMYEHTPVRGELKMTRIVMNEPTGLYQVAYIDNAPPLFRVHLKDGEISDWLYVKDLLHERDELRSKLDRVKEIANDLSGRPPEPAFATWAELFSIIDSRLDEIIKECE